MIKLVDREAIVFLRIDQKGKKPPEQLSSSAGDVHFWQPRDRAHTRTARYETRTSSSPKISINGRER
jgi:hypothetical protein